jgi:hypothetical protein
MTWRLIKIDSHYLSKAIWHKIIWAIAILTMVPLIYFIVLSFKIKNKLIRAKMIVVYSLLAMQSIIIILHYGFIPQGHPINSFASLTQALFKFLFYAFIFFVLFHDSIKMSQAELSKRNGVLLISIFVVILAIVITTMTLGYIERINETHDSFCTSSTWIVIKTTHFVISMILIVLGWAITKFVKDVNRSRGYQIDVKKSRSLYALWIIIITSNLNATVELIIELLLLIQNPENCYFITDIDSINAILWLFFRLSASNLWVWPTIYAFNPKTISEKEKLQKMLIEEDSYEHFNHLAPPPALGINRSPESTSLQSYGSLTQDSESSNSTVKDRPPKKLVISKLYKSKK